MHKLSISSNFSDYNVEFIDKLALLLRKINKEHQAHFLVDSKIYALYQSQLSEVKKGLSFYFFEAVEAKKTLPEILSYIEKLIKTGVQRKQVLVVIGGGLVQDIGSFTAHIILRGIDWIFIPTTLLAMADSCIGSKSGINVSKFKNQVGAFHPPSLVYIYPFFLKTLPRNMILDGIGEIIKHSLIKGGKSFRKIRDYLKYIPGDKKKTEEAIYESLLIKKEIVEKDELEKNIRRLLNYGHSFGHALEGFTKNKIPHGIGVTIGMDMANYISLKKGYLSKNEFDDISGFLRKYIPYKSLYIKRLDLYMEFLSRDKKVEGNEINAILSLGVGKIEIIRLKLDMKLSEYIKEYCQYFNQK